jgi:hypothetical protein
MRLTRRRSGGATEVTRPCTARTVLCCPLLSKQTLLIKLYTLTPTRKQVTNRRNLAKDIRYNPTCFGALRHHHQGKNTKTLSDKTLDDWTQLWLKNFTSVTPVTEVILRCFVTERFYVFSLMMVPQSTEICRAVSHIFY